MKALIATRNGKLKFLLFCVLAANMSWLSLLSTTSIQSTDLATLTADESLRDGETTIRVGNRAVRASVQKNFNINGGNAIVLAINIKREFGLNQAQLDRLKRDCRRCDGFFFRDNVAYRVVDDGFTLPDLSYLSRVVRQVKGDTRTDSPADFTSRDDDPLPPRRPLTRSPRTTSDHSRIQSEVFRECNTSTGASRIECYASLMSEYRARLEEAGANDTTIDSRIKAAYARIHPELSKMARSEDAEKREAAKSAIDSLRQESVVYNHVDRLEEQYYKYNKRHERNDRLKEVQEDFLERYASASSEVERRALLSEMAMKFPKEYKQLIEPALRMQRTNEIGQNANPLLNPQANCWGDICLPNPNFQNSMFTNNRCLNPGFGSSMIGVSPMFMPQQPFGCQVGMPMGLNMSMMGFPGAIRPSPFFRPTFGAPMSVPYLGGMAGLGTPRPLFSTNFGANIYGSSVIASPLRSASLTMPANNIVRPPTYPMATQPAGVGVRSSL